jgi:hypothetical protein
MPLYHFDILRDGIEEPDGLGTEFSSDEDAIEGASRGLAEILMDEPRAECRLRCVVRRETLPVATITLAVVTQRGAVNGKPASAIS